MSICYQCKQVNKYVVQSMSVTLHSVVCSTDGCNLKSKVKSKDIREQLKINIKMIEDIMQYQKQ